MPARGWVILSVRLGNFSSRSLAKEMRPICSHRCNINALSTGALPPFLPDATAWLAAAPSCLCGRVGVRRCGQHCGRYARVGLQNWQPSDSSRGLKKGKHTHKHTHTDIEGRMAKSTMIYGPEASGSRNRKSHKSRAAIRSIKLLKIRVGENRKWQSNGEGRSKRQSK